MMNPISIQSHPKTFSMPTRGDKTAPGYFIELDRRHPNRYHENAVWQCRTFCTGRTYRISGPLAEVLERYPDDFDLKLIAAPSVRKGGYYNE